MQRCQYEKKGVVWKVLLLGDEESLPYSQKGTWKPQEETQGETNRASAGWVQQPRKLEKRVTLPRKSLEKQLGSEGGVPDLKGGH